MERARRLRARYPRPTMANKQIGIRVPDELLSRCDEIAARVPGFTRATVVRVAIETGLAAMEADPRYSPREGGATKRRK